MRIAIKTQFAALAAGALMIGLTVAAPTARAAEIVDRSAIVSDSNPVEMQRRGGFRAGPRIAGRPGGGGFRGGPGPRRGGGGGGGNLGAAIGLGAAALIIGGAAAAAASQQRREEYRECWVERRWVDGPYGPERRNIRVCN